MSHSESAWQAVQHRDARFDGSLYYGVKTTGIFCRPSCPSRRPNRANVRFFESVQEAQSAGFRECSRCRPGGVTDAAAAVQSAKAYLLANIDRHVSLDELGREAGMSPYHLQRVFKSATGLSPKAFCNAARSERFKQALNGASTVLDAALEAGFGSQNAAYAVSKQALAMTPGQYRRGGAGVDLACVVRETPLGSIVVAASERGVASVQFCTPESASAAVQGQFPRANIEWDLNRVDATLREHAVAWADAVAAYFERRTPIVPLDLNGTEFQRRVWASLQTIPAGQTRTYAEVAEALGAPNAVRAVARACATNPAALVVPCHRVVRGDGSLAGYRWGLERKRDLLAREKSGE